MKGIKILPLVIIAVIAAIFIGMLIALLIGNNDLFFIFGAVLIGALISGYFVLQAYKKKIHRPED